MTRSHAQCWIGGRVLPAAQATVSVMDHGLLYGDGVFEGIRFYGRRVFRLREHLDRLERSARAICLELPLSREAIAAAISATIEAFAHDDGYLRVVVTRGVGKLGIDPRSCPTPGFFVIADELSMASQQTREQGARLITASTRQPPLDTLDPRIKGLNYLVHILARIEANQAGVDEAVMLNHEGKVAEGAAQNLFIARQGELLTPPTIDGALEGVTRSIIFELAADAGIVTREASLAPYDLHGADECFLTGTGAELLPVAEIDGRRLRACPGPIYQQLAARFRRLTQPLVPDTASNAKPCPTGT